MKSLHHSTVKKFTDIPNVGVRIAADFETLGIKNPNELAKQDPVKMYKKLEKITGMRQDPCVLDTYIAVVDFMNGAKARPWWHYTTMRKKLKKNF